MLGFAEFIAERSINVNLSHKDVSNHLKTRGWAMQRTQGGHDVWGHPKAQRKIAVPRHRGDLAPGTVRQILKDADVD